MRIRGAKTELEEMGEDTSDMVVSTSKLRDEIKNLSGVDIMKDSNTFKSTYQILDELAAKWEDLEDIQQASITELIAGKRNVNIVSALMQNFDIARETLNTAENDSEGSAERELANYQKGIQYSLDKFTATLQDLITDAIDSGLVKQVIDFGTAIIDVIDGITNALGKLTIPVGAASIFAIFKGLKKDDEGVRAFKNIIDQPRGCSKLPRFRVGLLETRTQKNGLRTSLKVRVM